MTEELGYKTYKFPAEVNKKGRIFLNLPKICPLCGKKDNNREYKYKVSNKKYILIPICEEHYEIIGNKKQNEIRNLKKVVLFFIIAFIISLIIYIMTRINWIF